MDLNQKELKWAFILWHKNYNLKEIDTLIAPFLNEDMLPFKGGNPGWLKKARLALFLSSQTIANKLGVQRTAYSQYEQSEEKGSISLATLAKAAEAMNCELVYAIRPKAQTSFSDTIWKILLKTALHHPWLKKCDQKRRANALASIAQKQMMDPKIKQKNGWSERSN